MVNALTALISARALRRQAEVEDDYMTQYLLLREAQRLEARTRDAARERADARSAVIDEHP